MISLVQGTPFLKPGRKLLLATNTSPLALTPTEQLSPNRIIFVFRISNKFLSKLSNLTRELFLTKQAAMYIPGAFENA